jgi:arylsulfatase A-like enzyme/Flp pilus assembly protein TadD
MREVAERVPKSLFCAAALLVLVSCAKQNTAPPGLRPLNVVLVTIDTLRADRLGCYGYSKIETPALDKLAQRGVLFENAIAQAPLTSPSHASMLTGVYPTVHKVRDTGGFILEPANITLAEILREQGWDTAAFLGSAVLKKRFGLNQGFTVYDDEIPQSSEHIGERRSGEVVDRAVQWLDSQSGKPFFLWVHVYDPHLPYNPPSGFRQKYAGRPYDGEVAYTDQQLARLFDSLGRKSPENTIVMALSDHGESFSEHGEYAHGVFLYDSTLRIPFLLSGPGIPAGVRVKQQVRTIDLLPTVLDVMGGQVPPAVQGVSLRKVITGNADGLEWSYAETLFPRLNMNWAELRAVRTNRWKYIRSPRPELYNLFDDPGETNNVIGRHPAEVREMEERLKAVTRNVTEKVQPAQPDQRTLAQLKSLGYLGGSSEREYALTGAGVDPKDRTDVLRLLHFGVHSELPLSRRIAMLREAVAKDPTNPSLYSNLGDLYGGAGRLDEAMKLYLGALNKGIRSAWLYSRLGHLCLRQGKKSDAIPFFESAAQMNPADYESLQNLAVAYRETGKLPEAERLLRVILASGEEFPAAYNELGMIEYQKGDLAAARSNFERAAQRDPAYQLNLARLYKMTGEKERAKAAFEAFLASKSSSPEYRQIIPQVKQELASVQ